MSIDSLQHRVITTIAKVAAAEGTALGIGGPLDELPSAVVALGQASRFDFVRRYADVSKALHENWSKRVGSPTYMKSAWMEIDIAVTEFAREVAASVGHEGSWVRWASRRV